MVVARVNGLGMFAYSLCVSGTEDPADTFGRYRGLILSGSPALSAHDADSGWSRGVLDLGIPVLGLCFGHQEIAKHAGGEVEHTKREYGAATLHVVESSPLFKGLESEELVWMTHGDTVTRLPSGFVELGYSTGGLDGSADHRLLGHHR